MTIKTFVLDLSCVMISLGIIILIDGIFGREIIQNILHLLGGFFIGLVCCVIGTWLAYDKGAFDQWIIDRSSKIIDKRKHQNRKSIRYSTPDIFPFDK